MSVIDRIWAEDHLVELEREIWLQIMVYQWSIDRRLVSSQQILASRRAKSIVRLHNIHDREMVTKHDLKARLDEFCELSGHERIHLGCTSADIVENTYLIRQRRSVLALGLQHHNPQINHWLKRQMFRGVRGPVGSDQDQLDLLGSAEAVAGLNLALAKHFGFSHVIGNVSQCMPRSLDMELGALLLATIPIERTADRMVANGLLTTLAAQEFWNEGDVATSVVRRYAWPMMFKTIEGTLLEGR